MLAFLVHCCGFGFGFGLVLSLGQCQKSHSKFVLRNFCGIFLCLAKYIFNLLNKYLYHITIYPIITFRFIQLKCFKRATLNWPLIEL